MKDFNKIIRINLLVMLAYAVVSLLFGLFDRNTSAGTYDGLGFAVFMMVLIALQIAVNFILMIVKFVQGNREMGVSYLVSMFVVGLVGFSSCLGGTALLGK